MHSFHAQAGYGLCIALLLPFSANAGPVPTGKPSAYPDWWFQRDLIARISAQAGNPNPVWPGHYPTADDFAVANVGQLKLIASKAAEELNAFLPAPGAGNPVNNLVAAWDPGVANPARDDFSALNQGQLKYVASLFYDRLGRPYPWTTNTTGDDESYAMVNLGQLKRIFSFSINAGDDVDADGLLDMWEFTHFIQLSAQTASSNADGDSLNNRAEFLLGTNPTLSADESSQAATAVALVVYSP